MRAKTRRGVQHRIGILGHFGRISVNLHRGKKIVANNSRALILVYVIHPFRMCKITFEQGVSALHR